MFRIIVCYNRTSRPPVSLSSAAHDSTYCHRASMRDALGELHLCYYIFQPEESSISYEYVLFWFFASMFYALELPSR